jgi:SAM-dependent methyltransferase
VNNGQIIYRIHHQLKVINQKISLKPGMKILDYGCAKAAMSKRIKEEMPAIDCHFFDISEIYIRYWEKIAPRENHAIYHTPNCWMKRFDVVISNFSLEHIPDPLKSVSHIASMLKDDGIFYAIVPDTFGNKADFIVIDHVNHFTVSSLLYLLQQVGLSVVDIDSQSHRGALVVVAKKGAEPTHKHKRENVQDKVGELANYWGRMADHVKSTQAKLDGPFAIYGSGFYGAFIYSHLGRHSEIECFLDQSPFQQGKDLFGVPIVSPASLSSEVNTLFIGLNPKIARAVIEDQANLNRSGLKLVFLDIAI